MTGRLRLSGAVHERIGTGTGAGGIAAVIIPLPLIGFLIYGAVSDSMNMGQALAHGLIVSAVFALSALIVTIKKKQDKPFERVR